MAQKLKRKTTKHKKAVKAPIRVQSGQPLIELEPLIERVRSFKKLALILTTGYVLLSTLFKLVFTYNTFEGYSEWFGQRQLLFLLVTIILPSAATFVCNYIRP